MAPLTPRSPPFLSEAGMVREPDSFDEVVAPGGGSIQAAIDRCREGGAILIQPGTYTLSEGSLHLIKELHVFGRGLARLRPVQCDGIRCSAAAATLDGLVLERMRGTAKFIGLNICAGGLRLQNSIITGSFSTGLVVTRGDPVIVACRCVRSLIKGRGLIRDCALASRVRRIHF